MKNNLLLIILIALSLSIYFSCSHFHNRHDINISVSESSYSYRLTAYFNKTGNKKVQRYINDCIKPNEFEGNYIDVNTILDDKTSFYIKSVPGKLFIKLDKRENSEASYRRIKKMCEGIKEVLAKK
jgi:hypothetical protein